MAALLRAKFCRLLRKCLFQDVSSTSPSSTSLSKLNLLISTRRQVSICSATISRIPKKVYSRKYKVRLVQPDGSSFFIRYEKPLKLIKQPINPAEMTEEEKRARMRRLKPEKPKTIYELEDEDGDHDQRSWANLMKKKS
nr:large ribosomal subunit protein mL55-like [Pocillopora verrucosa]